MCGIACTSGKRLPRVAVMAVVGIVAACRRDHGHIWRWCSRRGEMAVRFSSLLWEVWMGRMGRMCPLGPRPADGGGA